MAVSREDDGGSDEHGSHGDVDPARCPICGEGNACGRLQGLERCWCFDATFRPAVLELVPAPARNRACICARCAATAPDADPI
jgi:hypothetical protein